MSKKNKSTLSPEDKMMCAIFGKPLSEVTEADMDRLRQKFPELMAKIDAEQILRRCGVVASMRVFTIPCCLLAGVKLLPNGIRNTVMIDSIMY